MTALHTARECSILTNGDDNHDGGDGGCDGDDNGHEGGSSECSELEKRANSATLVLALSNGDSLSGGSGGIRGLGPVNATSDLSLVWLTVEGDAVFRYGNDLRIEEIDAQSAESGANDDWAIDHLVSMTARELSVLGGFELATSGDVILHLLKQSEDVGAGHRRAMDDLRHFKVSGFDY